MIVVFLGAGFSSLGGVPLASQLFDLQPLADIISRQDLIERVMGGWEEWNNQKSGTPEEYLAYLEATPGKHWFNAVKYVALAITLSMHRVRISVSGQRPRITHHSLNLVSGIKTHEDFWTAIFRQTTNVCVLTTNYDILAERGLRTKPRPRLPRPGFHYGTGPEQLKGGGYPGVVHTISLNAKGTIPLLKLHGSVSWSLGRDGIERYHDCRPAISIRGNPAIIAPVSEKRIPSMFKPIWDRAESALSKSNIWIVVGYSFPEYDMAIKKLFQSTVSSRTRIHIMDPDSEVSRRVQSLLPAAKVFSHSGLPDALDDLPDILGN